jgi:hypothetical protein
MLTIIREKVKIGRNAEHARLEAGWPAAFGRAKSPDYYLACTSLTGANEAWFLVPYASNAAIAEGMKRDDADPVLSAELARLSRADGDLLDGTTTVQTIAQPELSHGAYPDLTKVRFWEITWWRIKPGHEADFAAAAKAYGAAASRAGPSVSYRVYRVIAGVPGLTYVIFSSVDSYEEFDQRASDQQATMRNASDEEQQVFRKFFDEAVISVETNRFRLDPGMSYVSKEVRATDPAFWTPKRPAKAAAQP